jgi:hypothetical protein
MVGITVLKRTMTGASHERCIAAKHQRSCFPRAGWFPLTNVQLTRKRPCTLCTSEGLCGSPPELSVGSFVYLGILLHDYSELSFVRPLAR